MNHTQFVSDLMTNCAVRFLNATGQEKSFCESIGAGMENMLTADEVRTHSSRNSGNNSVLEREIPISTGQKMSECRACQSTVPT